MESRNTARADRRSNSAQSSSSGLGVQYTLPQRILLIEDDESFAQSLAFALEQRADCDVLVAADSFEAGNLMSQHAFDLVITDWRLPAISGFSALRKAAQGLALDPTAPSEWFGHKKVPVIVITVCDAEEIEREKKLKGQFLFLGVVSKEQALEGILEQIQTLYGNSPLLATG